MLATGWLLPPELLVCDTTKATIQIRIVALFSCLKGLAVTTRSSKLG